MSTGDSHDWHVEQVLFYAALVYAQHGKLVSQVEVDLSSARLMGAMVKKVGDDLMVTRVGEIFVLPDHSS
jgi:hypothetical protein